MADPKVPPVVAHLERHLGPIRRGWKGEDSSPIQVIPFGSQPSRGVTTYATLGLSNVPLVMPRGRQVRQELIVSVFDRYPEKDVASFLWTFAEHVRSTQRALFRGEVIGPSNPLFSGV